MTRFWTAVRHRLEYGLVLAARGLDRLLGRRRSTALAAALGRFVYRRLGVRAEVVEDQLRHAFPDRDEAWIRATAQGAYEHLAREAMMLIRLSRLGTEAVRDVTEPVEDFDALRTAMEEGRGAILAAGHVGNWEVCGAGLAVRGIPVDAVAREQSNPLTDRLINRSRARFGITVIPMGSATRRSLEALAHGRAVGLVADQDARDRGVFVPFFGRPASTFRGPAVLALRTGAPVFLVAAMWADGRYTLHVRRIAVPDESVADRERTLTAAIAGALEALVREHPTQYLWHHRRWKTRPPEKDPQRGGVEPGAPLVGGADPGNGDPPAPV